MASKRLRSSFKESLTGVNKKKEGTRYTAEDDDFFNRAASHHLALAESSSSFAPTPSDKALVFKALRHDYTLKKVK